MKVLGLETCSDVIIGDAMKRGISGGEKKRLTLGIVEIYAHAFLQSARCYPGYFNP